MIRNVVIGSVLLLAACGGSQGGGRNATAPAGGPEVGIEPGEWEMKFESVKVEGGPPDMEAGMAAAAKGKVERQCITPEEAGNLFGQGGEGCKREGDGFRNGRIAGKLTCTQGDPPQTSTHEVSGSYSASSLDITQTVTNPFEGGTMKIETHSTGRRIGDCPARTQN